MQATIVLDTSVQNAKRFPLWIGLAVFSAICVIAVDSELKTASDKWVLAVTVISLLISITACGCYMMARGRFVAKATETAMVRTDCTELLQAYRTRQSFFFLSPCFHFCIFQVALLTGFWIAGLPVIMSPALDSAVTDDVVQNANLYFFSWGSVALVVCLVTSLIQETHGFNVRDHLNVRSKKQQYLGLFASSLVVLFASSRQHMDWGCFNGPSFCRSIKLGITVSVFSAVGAAVLYYRDHYSSMSANSGLIGASAMFMLWCFGVLFVTFGDNPGSKIGNLYFSCWASFLLSLYVFATSFSDYLSNRQASGVDPNDVIHAATGMKEMSNDTDEDEETFDCI